MFKDTKAFSGFSDDIVIIVGSALVEVLERGEDPAPWLVSLRPTAR